MFDCEVELWNSPVDVEFDAVDSVSEYEDYRIRKKKAKRRVLCQQEPILIKRESKSLA
jgi:hypothetical protein